MSNRSDARRNQISYIASGGETIAAVTGRGDLFTMNLTQKTDTTSSTSTTNPSKIKGAVTQPQCIWNAHKDGVRSVDVGEHGSVIISTASGAVWRRVKRAKVKDSHVSGTAGSKRKDFKFQRVPSITKIVTVRSSVFGAFAAVRKDSDVMREQIDISEQTLWDDIAPLNCLRDFEASEPSTKDKDTLKFWNVDMLKERLGSVAYEVLKSPDLESDLQRHLTTWKYQNEDLDTAVCTSSVPDVAIPVHSWLLSARCPVLRNALAEFRRKGSFDVADTLCITAVHGKTLITFTGLDLIAVLNLVLYVYEDKVIPAWNYTRQAPPLAYRYRQIRTDLMKVATKLDMNKLEAAVRMQTTPKRSMDEDFRVATKDRRFFDDGDAILELDGAEVTVHSTFLCQRCPFFEGLFNGRSRGLWLAGRREAQGATEKVRIDLKHIEPETFKYVLRYLYADMGGELFEPVVSDSLDDFSDLVMDVMGVANELMLDRLSQICQQVIGRFINTRNISHYLNAISPCAVSEFKDAGLEYICLQMESMLENHLLDDLDEDLMLELDEVVRDNQLALHPFAKSGREELLLHERYPELAQDIDEERQRRVKEMAYKATQRDDERKLSTSLKTRFGSLDDTAVFSSSPDRVRRKSKVASLETFSPALRPKASQGDLIFDMDEEDASEVDSPSIRPQNLNGRTISEDMAALPGSWSDANARSIKHASHPQLSSSSVGQAGNPTLAMSRSPTASPGTHTPKPGNPWGPAVLPTSKLDLRDVLADSTPPRSALSAGLAAQNAKEVASKSTPAKLSQKERKKQQQLQASQEAQSSAAAAAKIAWEKSSGDSRPAPWKKVSRDSSSTPGKAPTAHGLPTPPNPKPLLAAESSKAPHRRTASPDTRFSGQSRTPSAPTVPSSASPRPPAQPAPASSPLVPHSKSYIKPAPKAEPTLGLSMADIIGQQKREQEKVKEAVAKRSLQEIQEEQAFQEWWDQESRRAQEEEARRVARETQKEEKGAMRGRRGRSGKTRGGGQSAGGRGGGNSAAGSPAVTTPAEGEGRPRGKRRGGGGGGKAS